MICKVNRVSSVAEAKYLEDVGVDIIGITVNRLKKDDPVEKYDSRAISYEEAIRIRKSLSTAKLCIHEHWYSYFDDSFDTNAFKKVWAELHPDYVNEYVQLPHLHWKDSHDDIKSLIGSINKSALPVIVFGNAIGYDTPLSWDSEDLKLFNNLAYIEMACESIVESSWCSFRSEEVLGIKQSETSGVLLDTVIYYFEQMPVLVCDEFVIESLLSDLQRVKAKGISVSLESTAPDMFTEKAEAEFAFLSEITYLYYDLDSVVAMVRAIKEDAEI
ncbi:hypothetical protein QNI16_23865 [Cytophagaceae bacterium YF14B1]|uniref:Uncharacterized protein n=1 Tax=Xanthocytophaga flava TaxID=3048013 RepID=A0AAE3U8L2_9BACT|nr:hypothetical protein [Xanthocytophaga flavus]MDJ1483556.1 hypothetical protein [Xanthocytophaga flavus]